MIMVGKEGVKLLISGFAQSLKELSGSGKSISGSYHRVVAAIG